VPFVSDFFQDLICVVKLNGQSDLRRDERGFPVEKLENSLLFVPPFRLLSSLFSLLCLSQIREEEGSGN
jgi:hypothetical protein